MGKRDQYVAIREKQRLAAAGELACAVCGWRPPEDFGAGALSRCIQLHHVVPIADGGADSPENMVPLCPTHHAVAHALHARRDSIVEGARPSTREKLVEALRWIDMPREQRGRVVDGERAATRARADQQRRLADWFEWLAGRAGEPHARGLRGAAALLRDMIAPLPGWWKKGPDRAYREACGEEEQAA